MLLNNYKNNDVGLIPKFSVGVGIGLETFINPTGLYS